MNIWKRAKRELKRNLTVMLIPHNSVKPVRINFSLTFLLFLVASWTGFTLWAGYLSSRHIDYWKIQADQKLMQLKVGFFAEQVKKSQEMLDQVKENDAQVRTLLKMRSKQEIIEAEGQGGPREEESRDLGRLLSGRIHEMSEQDIRRQTAVLQEETRHRLESQKEIFTHIERERAVYRATPAIWPCVGHVTSPFGFRIHPIYGDNEFHSGLDIANSRNT
ncbi:MAG: M23 family metallopeptidase, partial [Endomicrobiales bacterium]